MTSASSVERSATPSDEPRAGQQRARTRRGPARRCRAGTTARRPIPTSGSACDPRRSALDRIHDADRIGERRVPAPAVVDQVRPHRRRERVAGELAPGIVGREPRRERDQHGEQREPRGAAEAATRRRRAYAPRTPRSADPPSRARRRPRGRRPRGTPPPPRRSRRRGRCRAIISACCIRSPRPGHVVTISTANDPLKSDPTITP